MKIVNQCCPSIEECLKDAGCSQETIHLVMDCIAKDEDERKLMILKKHRCYLLEKIHCDQKQLDCLDYLLYQLKQESKEK